MMFRKIAVAELSCALLLLAPLTPALAVSEGDDVGAIACPDTHPAEKVGTQGGIACLSSTEMYGPFTEAMRILCLEAGQGAKCLADTRWEREAALQWRGEGRCPFGSVPDSLTGYCVEGGVAFGPFPADLRAACANPSVGDGGASCENATWSSEFLRDIFRFVHGQSNGSENQGPGGEGVGEIPRGAEIFETVTTGYSTENTRIEGGPMGADGSRLITLKDFLAGGKPYVSVAMDDGRNGTRRPYAYGTVFRIPEIEKRFGMVIPFKLVDTGSAFAGEGKSRMDICMGHSQSDIYEHPFISGHGRFRVWVVKKP